jgi:hypothetical protein
MFVPTVDFNDRVLCHKLSRFRNFKRLTKDKAARQRVDFNQNGAAPVLKSRQLKGCFVL